MNDLIASYVEAVVAEIAYLGRQQPQWIIHTIFFGGGTPSLLSATQLEAILRSIHRWFVVSDNPEVTLEANPNDLTEKAYLADLRRVGINRLSMGVQSTIDRDLTLFARRHDTPMVEQAFQNARAVGFSNISLDLMYGIPYQTLAEWEQNLFFAVQLRPEHISFYGLELKGGTELTKLVKNGGVPAPDDDLAADMYDFATTYLAQAGYHQYEISNWCLEGFEGKHNLQYWHNAPYWGIGAGAHGYLAGVRTIDVRLPQRYIGQLLANHSPTKPFPQTPATAKSTHITWESEMAETMMMGLRLTQEGVNRARFYERFGVELHIQYADPIKKFLAMKMLTLDEVALRLTPQARLVSNAVIAEFI